MDEPLMSDADAGIAEELKGIDVNALTPLQALALLSEWKEKLK